MNVEAGVLAAVGGWDHEGLAINHEAGVAEKPFIEDAVHGLAIVDSAIGFADDTSPRGGHFEFRTLGNELRASAKDGKRKV